MCCTCRVTLPGQSRSSLAMIKREQGIDIVKQFQDISPETEPISIQRWSGRRVRVSIVAAFGIMFAIGLLFDEIRGAGVL